MKMILSLLIPSLCFAGFSDFGGDDLYNYKKEKVNNIVIKKKSNLYHVEQVSIYRLSIKIE